MRTNIDQPFVKRSLLLGKLLMVLFLTAWEIPAYGQIMAPESIPLEQAIEDLEAEHPYKFYYLPQWIADQKVKYPSGSGSIKEILLKLLDSTPLNFYISTTDSRVYLLVRTRIREQLPPGFFGEAPDNSTSALSNNKPLPPPVFLEENEINRPGDYPLIQIGKESPASAANSYRLSGVVYLEGKQEPVPDLPIRVPGANLMAVTDEQGQFVLNLPPGYHILEISGMGIASRTQPIVIYSDGSVRLPVAEGVEQLKEVVVEADAARNVENSTAGEEVIDPEASKNVPLVFGERDVLQLARSLPGISSAGEGASGINVRGGKTDQTLVLLDGGVVYNPSHFFGIFQALNPFTTKNVQIYKAMVPVQYGGRLSSLFEINSIDGNTQEFSGEGSIGPVTSNLALEFPLKEDRSSLVVGGRGVYSDWILKSLDEPSLNNSEASFYDGIIRFHSLLGEADRLSATAYYSDDRFNITTDSLYRYSNAMLATKWEHQLSERSRGTLELANSDYRFGIQFDNTSNADFDLDYGINQSQLRYSIEQNAGAAHRLTYGLSSNFYRVNPGRKSPRGGASAAESIEIKDEQALETALFIGDTYQASDRLEVDAGLRFLLYSFLGEGTQRTYRNGEPRNEASVVDTLQYGALEPVATYLGTEFRLSARYLLKEDLSLKASIGNAYQFLHTLSNNTTVSPIDTWKLSDLNLRPQKGYQASLGIFRNLMDNQVEVSLEGYYKWMDDVLDFKTGASLFLNPHVETEVLQGNGKAYGLEFLLKKKSGDLNGWLSYTYSRAFYQFDGNSLEEQINRGEFFPANFDKPHDLSFIGNYRFTRRYSVSMNFTYQTGRPVTYPVGTYRFNNADYVVYSDRNKARIPDYYRLDLGLNIEGNHRKNKLAHSFWTISVYNVLGRNNPYSVFFVTDNGEVKALQTSIFAVPVPSITYNFKF